MRAFSFYFHSGAARAAYPTTTSASRNGINDLRASGYATRGRRPCCGARAGGRGRRPRGGDDPPRSVTTPLFIATQPAYGTCLDELWPPIKQTYLRQGIANSIGYFLVYSRDRRTEKKNYDKALRPNIIISLCRFGNRLCNIATCA